MDSKQRSYTLSVALGAVGALIAAPLAVGLAQEGTSGMLDDLAKPNGALSWADFWRITIALLLTAATGIGAYVAAKRLIPRRRWRPKEAATLRPTALVVGVSLPTDRTSGSDGGTVGDDFGWMLEGSPALPTEALEAIVEGGATLPDGSTRWRDFSWQPVFKTIRHYLDEGCDLRTLHILPSSSTADYARHWLEPAIAGVLERARVACSVETHEGVPYQDYQSVRQSLERIISRERQRTTRACICIDVTGGDKAFTATAAMEAMEDDVFFSFVSQIDNSTIVPCDVVSELEGNTWQ